MIRLEATLYSSPILENAPNNCSFCQFCMADMSYLAKFFMCVNRTFTLTFDISAYFHDHNEMFDFHFLQG